MPHASQRPEARLPLASRELNQWEKFGETSQLETGNRKPVLQMSVALMEVASHVFPASRDPKLFIK